MIDVEKFQQAYKRGLSDRELADEFEISVKAAKDFRKQFGFQKNIDLERCEQCTGKEQCVTRTDMLRKRGLTD